VSVVRKFQEKGVSMVGARDLRNAAKKGRLDVICGSMFSGKSEELIRRLRRYEYARKRVLTISHKIDTRRGTGIITSHSGETRTATSIENGPDGMQKILAAALTDADVIGIDEIQFFAPEIINVIMDLVDAGKDVVVAGLDLDFRGEPFGIMPTLLTLADNVLKLKAICVICAGDAHHTQRIVNGKPANYDDPIILVGAAECYEARCRKCFSIIKKPQKQPVAQPGAKAKPVKPVTP
jgi:thymidine kinase